MDGFLELRILVPDGDTTPLQCDSVEFTVADNNKGKGGGRYTVKKGHTKAIMILSEGDVVAKFEGKEIYREKINSGIAEVKQDKILVMTSDISF